MGLLNGQQVVQGDFVSTSAGAGDSGKVPKLNINGLNDVSFLGLEFGDGSDGDITISTPTTLSSDMYYNNLVVTSTLTTAGYRIFVKGTLSGGGTIDWGLANNGAVGLSLSGGAGGTQTGAGHFKNTAGGSGGGPNSAGSVGGGTNIYGAGIGGTGGYSTRPTFSNVNGGVGGAFVAGFLNKIKNFSIYFTGLNIKTDFTNERIVPSGGGGGAGGAGSGAPAFGGGGGGGASGGTVWICAKIWAGTFTIKAVGGNGGNGGFNGGSGTYNAPAGGGGGGGGVSITFFGSKSWAGSYNLAGGTGGNPETGNGVAYAGANGTTGISYEIPILGLI